MDLYLPERNGDTEGNVTQYFQPGFSYTRILCFLHYRQDIKLAWEPCVLFCTELGLGGGTP